MTIFCERRRATDPKTPIDWLSSCAVKLFGYVGVFAFGALMGAGFVVGKYEVREIKTKMESTADCGSCKKGVNK